MSIKHNFLTKHTLYCPKCNAELFFDATSKNTDFLKCKNESCNSYYSKKRGIKLLQELGLYSTVLRDLEEKGLTDWPGIATSIAYKPWLVKIVEKVFLKKSSNS